MTDPEDPLRLTDSGSAAPAGLRKVLEGAVQDVGNEAQLARLAGRLGPMLAPLGVVAAPPAATPGLGLGAKLGLGVKLGLGAIGLLAAGGGFLLLGSPHGKEGPPVTAPAPLPSPPTPSHAPAASNERANEALDPPPSAGQAKQASEPEQAPAAKPREKALAARGPSEAQLLEQARRSLGADPNAALARVNEHASRFPRGVLVQEREVIAIKALRQLGRAADADRRAQAFSKSFPGSAFQPKL